MSSESYSMKDMQQLMMNQLDEIKKANVEQSKSLVAIDSHLSQLNGKVARHQEVLFSEPEGGIVSKVSRLETKAIEYGVYVVIVSVILGIIAEVFIKKILA